MRLERQTEDFYNSQFYKDWVFQMPRDWTILPGNRVISQKGDVFFPNGIMERTDTKSILIESLEFTDDLTDEEKKELAASLKD